MIISGGFIDCVLNATGQDISGNSYSDYSHHRWTITGSSGPIAGTAAINGTPVQATWTVTGYGHHASNTPGNGISWTRNAGPVSAPLVAYPSGNMIRLQRYGTANSIANGFKSQPGNLTSNADEIGLVGLMGPGTIGLAWSSSLQASSFSMPYVTVMVQYTSPSRSGFLQPLWPRLVYSLNPGAIDTNPGDIKNWFYQNPGTPASASWHWEIDF
jgi:hypothetical protein